MSTKELYDLGDQPPLGEVPQKMHAFMVRQDRFGKPIDAWKSRLSMCQRLALKMYWSMLWLLE